MLLKSLALTNYKNFGQAYFEFDEKINCMVGKNGIGKTNVLDAIYHLSYGKSYFNPVATQNVKHDEAFFVIDGKYHIDDKNEKIIIGYKKGQKKTIKRNSKEYERFSDHIGLLPLVIISPADRNIIQEGSDVRRKFIDSIISQSDKMYLNDLIQYNKVITQRNALLKYFFVNRTFNEITLEAYNQKMVTLGTPIHQKRHDFLTAFVPLMQERYAAISNQKESVNIHYKSALNDQNFLTALEESLKKDRAMQYTTVGIHKDDLIFDLDGHSVKKFGSQGQQKSYLIALKLAQFDFLKQQSNQKPILVLDDIFDKLDESRVAQLINLVKSDQFGQIFISDTHAERTEELVKNVHQTYKMFPLNEG